MFSMIYRVDVFRVCLEVCRHTFFFGSGVNPQGETVLNDTRAFELKVHS
jgi:hypothetical protein